MIDPDKKRPDDGRLFEDAVAYDRSINWSARIEREVPVLKDVFGPPGAGGIVDAGCGTGRQTVALAQQGYRMTGVDFSPEMLRVADTHAAAAGCSLRFVSAAYADLHAAVGGGFDGVCCLGNALAAAGTRTGVATALRQFAHCLRPGGRLFFQILNFAPMRAETPCVRGPRVVNVDGREHISVRVFHFEGDHARVTNTTLFNADGWQLTARSGQLYPVGLIELEEMCAAADLAIQHRWGDYSCERFDPDQSQNLLIVAAREEKGE